MKKKILKLKKALEKKGAVCIFKENSMEINAENLDMTIRELLILTGGFTLTFKIIKVC
jgi:hypothetical protein